MPDKTSEGAGCGEEDSLAGLPLDCDEVAAVRTASSQHRLVEYVTSSGSSARVHLM